MKISLSQLKSDEKDYDSSVWLVTGPDDYGRKQAVKRIQEIYLDSAYADFDSDRFDGPSLDAAKVLSAWQTFPLGSKRRVITISGVEDSKATELQKLTAWLSEPCATGCLLLEASTDNTKDLNALAKAVDQAGIVVTCSAPKPDDATAFLKQDAIKQGVTIEPQAAQEMVRRVGADIWQLSTELLKLTNYIHPDQIIRKQHVEEMIPDTPEDRVFAMIDNVVSGNTRECSKMLEDSFRASNDDRSAAHKTLALLCRQFRLLWQARILYDNGFTFKNVNEVPASVLEYLPTSPSLIDLLKKQSWLMSRYRQQVDKFSLKKLAKAFELLAETDLALKGRADSAGSPFADMEMLMWRLGMLAGHCTSKRPRA